MPCRAAIVALTATAARAGDGMTADELTKAAELWVSGMPMKDIAETLRVPYSTLHNTIGRNRDMFPKRYRLTQSDYLIERVRANRATNKDVVQILSWRAESARLEARIHALQSELEESRLAVRKANKAIQKLLEDNKRLRGDA